MRKILALCAGLLLVGSWPSVSRALQIDDDQPIDIELKAADLAETLRSFAEISGRKLVLDPSVTGSVTIDLHGVPWKEVLDGICRAQELSCQLLDGEPPLLRVLPAARAEGSRRDAGLVALSTHSPASTEGVNVRVRLRTAGGDLEAMAHFSWAESIVTLGSEESEVEARLVWIPFSPDLHFVLPIVAVCREGEVEDLEVLEMARLPLAGGWKHRSSIGDLELEMPAGEGRTDAAANWISRCLERPAGNFEAVFYPRGGEEQGTGRRNVQTSFFNRVGVYLLITPYGEPSPRVAVVVLGSAPGGGQRLAIVRPGGGEGDVELLDLSGDETVRRTLSAPDGTSFVLELRAVVD